MNKSLFLGILLLVVVGGFFTFREQPKETKPQPKADRPLAETQKPMNTKTLAKPEMQIDENKSYTAVIKTTLGDMTIKLFADKTPITVNNFVYLSRENYYNDVIFHRVIEGFMIQGGDPTGTGRGDPGYKFEDEFHPTLKHSKAGILSMANSGPDSNGSQFFITLGPTPHLDGVHSVFGEVTEGLDVLQKIGSTPTDPYDRPTTPVVIKSVEITEN